MEVKPGYKQTEVGVIPEDWGLTPLGDLFVFSGGYSASRAQLSDVGHCYLHYGDIHASTKTFLDVKADVQNIPRLNVALQDISGKSLLGDGDIVFVDASEDDEGASKHVVVVNKKGVPFISGLHTIVAKASTDELNHEYRRYCFQSLAIRKQFLYYAVGTKVKGISKTNIPKLLLSLPPFPEQRAIASALSDVDALLGGLDRLIAKKCDIKQAAMQQLLTGQTRLPGFHDEWEVKRLDMVADVLKGSGLSKSQTTSSGVRPCILYGELFTAYGRIIADVVGRTNSIDGCNSQQGDVLMPGSTTTTGSDLAIASALFVDGVALGGDIIIIRRKDDSYDSVFLANYLTHAKKQEIAEFTQGITIHHLYGKNMRCLSLDLPHLSEQTAIADVLSDMDAELAALEARRDKTRNLKQAMMQELLTGKTRLVTPEVPHA